jgi:hypothetical protein
MNSKRKWEQPISGSIPVPRNVFIAGVVFFILGSSALTLWQMGILPLVTSKHHAKQMKHVWKLKERVTIIETKLDIPRPQESRTPRQ